MADAVLVALIAGVVALSVAYINSFLAESYRRFRDGSTLAASLAGELASYEPAWPILSNALSFLLTSLDTGTRKHTMFRPFAQPRDLVFEDSVAKLGLLGTEIAENIVFVYSNIRAFRAALEVIMRDEKEMSDHELRARCVACQEALQRAGNRGEQLLVQLRARSTARFVPEWPWAAWLALFARYPV